MAAVGPSTVPTHQHRGQVSNTRDAGSARTPCGSPGGVELLADAAAEWSDGNTDANSCARELKHQRNEVHGRTTTAQALLDSAAKEKVSVDLKWWNSHTCGAQHRYARPVRATAYAPHQSRAAPSSNAQSRPWTDGPFRRRRTAQTRLERFRRRCRGLCTASDTTTTTNTPTTTTHRARTTITASTTTTELYVAGSWVLPSSCTCGGASD